MIIETDFEHTFIVYERKSIQKVLGKKDSYMHQCTSPLFCLFSLFFGWFVSDLVGNPNMLGLYEKIICLSTKGFHKNSGE